MNTQRRYSRAPITEALIDIRVQLPRDASLLNLFKVQSLVEPNYPRLQTQRIVQGQVTVGEAVETTTRQTDSGYLFLSGDGRRIFQARLDGFTFNQLAPYDHWEPFRDEARRLWSVYQMVAQPESILRIGVRTINRFDLPGPSLDFSDYLRTVPEVSPDLHPQGLSAYFMQLQIPQADMDAMLILNEAFQPPDDPNVIPVILDIDLFREHDLPVDEEGLWALFEQFRVRRNQVFEASITDRTRGLID